MLVSVCLVEILNVVAKLEKLRSLGDTTGMINGFIVWEKWKILGDD